MKKILTTLAAFVLTLPVWAQGLAIPFYFDTTCPGITYEDGKTLINNEVFRVLAVFNLTAGHTFELDADGNPIELDADGNPVTGAIFKWMTTLNFGTGTVPQDYAPVTDGITGITGLGSTTTLRVVQFSLSDIPTGYEMANYKVYFITQDTRVPEGEEKRLVKWNATFIDTFGPMFLMKNFAMNFEKDPYTPITVNSPTRLPYGVEPEPEITFPDDTSDDVKAAAIEALEAALGEDAAAVTKITNPEVAAAINGIITGPGTVVVEDGVARFTYEFKVTKITMGAEGNVTVTVSLGDDDAQSFDDDQYFADDVVVTLVDLEGAALTGVTVVGTKIEESGKNEATVTIQVDSDDIDTLLFKAKAMKADQTN